MRVALVHDWLTGLRGGERVLEVLCEIFPDATLFTLVYIKGTASPTIESLPIRTAFTQKLPGVRKYYRWYLPLYPWAIETLDLREFDLVFSSSHCVAKGVLPAPGARHISYCHTPMRYVWDQFADYFGTGLAARFVFGPFAHYLRSWDVTSTTRVDHLIANSRHVAERIRRYWRREVDAVIPPPVDTEFFVPSTDPPAADYYLIVSALAPYKRIDLAVEAFKRRNETLLIVGTGPEEARLRAGAPSNVRFLGAVPREEILRLYQNCRATLLPGVEDFGIVPLESQACGRPVVALRKGGALESIRDGETGVLFDAPTGEALSAAVDRVESVGFNKMLLRNWALQFSRERFKKDLQDFVKRTIS